MLGLKRIKDAFLMILREHSISTSSVFLSMLKALCRRPLMGKMIRVDNNLVGLTALINMNRQKK